MSDTFDETDVAALRLVVMRLSRRLRKHSGTGMTPSQFSALSVLGRHGPFSLGELARREQVGKSTVTRLVTKLEEQGLIERAVDDTDGRITVVRLTSLGKKHLSDASEQSTRYLSEQLGTLDATERAALLGALPALEHILATKP